LGQRRERKGETGALLGEGEKSPAGGKSRLVVIKVKGYGGYCTSLTYV